MLIMLMFAPPNGYTLLWKGQRLQEVFAVDEFHK